jgi:hypothetical protein
MGRDAGDALARGALEKSDTPEGNTIAPLRAPGRSAEF